MVETHSFINKIQGRRGKSKGEASDDCHWLEWLHGMSISGPEKQTRVTTPIQLPGQSLSEESALCLKVEWVQFRGYCSRTWRNQVVEGAVTIGTRQRDSKPSNVCTFKVHYYVRRHFKWEGKHYLLTQILWIFRLHSCSGVRERGSVSRSDLSWTVPVINVQLSHL